MKNICVLLFVFTLFISSAHSTPWDRLSPDEAAFCKVHMEKALKLYEVGEPEAAIQSLEDSYNLADQQFDNSFFVHRIIWWEAQVHSGKADEEWGLMMFRFLRDREHRLHPKHAIEIPGRDFVLYENIIDKLCGLGMLAQARAETLELENTLTTYKNFYLSGARYPDLGPLFTTLPNARKRDYPVRWKELNNSSRSDRHIYYCYLYGVQLISEIALTSGDWKKAAELADWYMQFNDSYALSDEEMRSEICKVALEATDTLAAISQLDGQPAEAAAIYESYLGKMDSGHYKTSTNAYYMAQLKLAELQIQMGTLAPEAVSMADTAVASIKVFPHFSRAQIIHAKLIRARIYHALGDPDEAWAIVNSLFDETSVDVNTYHQLRILTTAIDLALDEGGTHPELETWLVLALHNERQLGNKFNELPLYEKYAAFLEIQDRYDEAYAIRKEAIRLSKTMNLPRRTRENQLALEQLPPSPLPQPAEYAATAPSIETIDGETEPPVVKTQPATRIAGEVAAYSGTIVSAASPVDIQPRLSLSVALPGQSAHGRFYLTNPAITSQTGQIKIDGAVDQLKWQSNQWLTVQASPSFSAVSLSQSLKLQAGESCIIDITGLPAENGAGSSVRCSWMNGSELISEGVWEYSSEISGKRTTVIDAHELRQNPFYLVPINHTIQRQESHAAEAVDFAVLASAPMRIEAYNSSTGKLLYVDANGDGDFEDSGDYIGVDDNRNSWPDIDFKAGRNLASLVLYIKPDTQQSDAELTIKILDNNEWRVDAVDRIEFTTN